MKHMTLTLLAGGLAMSMAGEAAAQSLDGRIYAGLNFGVQTGSQSLATNSVYDLYGEQGTLTFATEAGGGAMFDLAAGYKVYRQFSVGIGYSRVSSDSDGTVAGTAPHPLFFNRPRSFSDVVSGLDRTEQAVHISFGYTRPVNDKIDVMVYGGPSKFRLAQDIVGSVTAAESGPPFTQVVIQPVQQEQKESTWGGHIGADLTYKFTDLIGAGGFLRWAGGSTDIEVLGASNLRQEVKTDVGGFQAGFGVRVRY